MYRLTSTAGITNVFKFKRIPPLRRTKQPQASSYDCCWEKLRCSRPQHIALQKVSAQQDVSTRAELVSLPGRTTHRLLFVVVKIKTLLVGLYLQA